MIRPPEILAYVAILSQVLFTVHVASQIVKVNVTPIVWAEVNQFDASALSNESRDVPERASHSLRAKPGWSFSDNLQNEGKYIYSIEEKTYVALFLVGLERDYTSGEKKRHVFEKSTSGILDNRGYCRNTRHKIGACFQDYFYCINNWRIAKFNWIPDAIWCLRLNYRVLPRFSGVQVEEAFVAPPSSPGARWQHTAVSKQRLTATVVADSSHNLI